MATPLAATTTVTEKRKSVFFKVEQLKLGTSGHTLTVKVASSNPMKTIVNKSSRSSILHARPSRIAECIFFTACNEQVELMNPVSTLILRNAKIDMFKGSIRLAVDKWGRIEVTEPAKFEVKEDNNLSLVEYELVNVVEE